MGFCLIRNGLNYSSMILHSCFFLFRLASSSVISLNLGSVRLNTFLVGPPALVVVLLGDFWGFGGGLASLCISDSVSKSESMMMAVWFRVYDCLLPFYDPSAAESMASLLHFAHKSF